MLFTKTPFGRRGYSVAMQSVCPDACSTGVVLDFRPTRDLERVVTACQIGGSRGCCLPVSPGAEAGSGCTVPHLLQGQLLRLLAIAGARQQGCQAVYVDILRCVSICGRGVVVRWAFFNMKQRRENGFAGGESGANNRPTPAIVHRKAGSYLSDPDGVV